MQKLGQTRVTVLFLLSFNRLKILPYLFIITWVAHTGCLNKHGYFLFLFFFHDDNYKPATFMNQEDQAVVVGVVFFLPLSWMTCFGA